MIESKPGVTRLSLLLLTLCVLLLTIFAFKSERFARDGQKNNQNDNRPPKNANQAPPKEKAPSLPPSKPGNTNANKPSP